MKTKIGMIGIGLMGHGIASNLLRHGHELALMEHAGNQPLDALKAAGAQSFGSAAEVAARSQVVILVLTGSPQVEAVLTGAGGSWNTPPACGNCGGIADSKSSAKVWACVRRGTSTKAIRKSSAFTRGTSNQQRLGSAGRAQGWSGNSS